MGYPWIHEFVFLVQVKDIPFDTICNGHGPMLRYNMRELVEDYAAWSAKVGKAPASVAVLYTDNYGFCDRLSQTVARGITKANIATEMIDLVKFPTFLTWKLRFCGVAVHMLVCDEKILYYILYMILYLKKYYISNIRCFQAQCGVSSVLEYVVFCADTTCT
jgi:hypothetical protein